MRSPAAWLSAVAALCVGAAFMAAASDFVLDDAWIHLAYAKSLRLGEGLSYNPNDFETGASSPLWALLLALVPLSLPPLLAVRGLTVLLHGVLAWLTADLAARLVPHDDAGDRARLSLMAGLLCACEALLAQASVSGMEVTLTAVLAVLVVRTLLDDKLGLCALCCGLSVLARPEMLPFAFFLCMGEALRKRSLRALWPVAGALAAALLVSGYDLLVSGYPYPNTKYAKAGGFHVASLAYLGRLFSSSAWFMSVVGGVALLRALWFARSRERAFVLVLGAAWLATILTIALSRPLDARVLFYQSRYFVILSALPCVLVPLGLVRLSARVQLLALTVLVAVSGLFLSHAREEVTALSDDVQRLHSEPAAYVAEALPPDARVLVEGAGALRYATPRTMRIIDLLGLNDASIVHAREVSGRAYACAIVARRPTFAVIPTEQLQSVMKVFRVKLLRTFKDPHFTQVLPPRPRSVFVLHVRGVNIPCPGVPSQR